MALSEFETKQIEMAMTAYVDRRRPPPHIREKLDLSFRLTGQSVEIFEIQPAWRAPHRKIEHSVAKAMYVKSQRVWKVYWMRQDLKWHRYDPDATVKNIDEFLAVVEKDEYGCFYG